MKDNQAKLCQMSYFCAFSLMPGHESEATTHLWVTSDTFVQNQSGMYPKIEKDASHYPASGGRRVCVCVGGGVGVCVQVYTYTWWKRLILADSKQPSLWVIIKHAEASRGKLINTSVCVLWCLKRDNQIFVNERESSPTSFAAISPLWLCGVIIKKNTRLVRVAEFIFARTRVQSRGATWRVCVTEIVIII